MHIEKGPRGWPKDLLQSFSKTAADSTESVRTTDARELKMMGTNNFADKFCKAAIGMLGLELSEVQLLLGGA